MLSRRRLLQAAALGTAGLAVYSYRRGIRFPVLSFEHRALKTRWQLTDTTLTLQDFILTPETNESNTVTLRAYTPEPQLQIETKHAQTLSLQINNIAPDARLEASDPSIPVQEEIKGISRRITITANSESSLILKWTLPELASYRFAAIGDSGGDLELEWCIKRAHQLGARFLLHLGDFNYQPGDYDNAIRLFNEAPLPCYVSIGNHDFHDQGLIYQQFLDQIGPFNHWFAIGKTRFANIDTAANTLPYAAGHRGKLMQALIANKEQFADTVAFTHRPLHDPLNGSDHDLGSEGERDWLIRKLKAANIGHLLSGHIHIFDRRDFNGIDNIIVGQGLGHQDLITNSDYSKIAIGKVGTDGRVTYEFPTLAMPMEIHCHPRVDVVKDSLRGGEHSALIERVDLACKARG